MLKTVKTMATKFHRFFLRRALGKVAGAGRGALRLLRAWGPGGVLHNPYLAAKLYPHEAGRRAYLVLKAPRAGRGPGAELPVPPRELRFNGVPPEQYLAEGRELVDRMKGVLQGADSPLRPGHRVLDFGCSDGQMVRWLGDLAEAGEVWGVDISGRHMIWCQQHLSPPFKFATTTTCPHLPFEDRHFDFVYAGSVFTHIPDLAEAWLLELRRILRPGGKLYVTVRDRHTIGLLLKGGGRLAELLRAFDRGSGCLTADFAMFTVDRAPGWGVAGHAQVFYDIDYLCRHWGNYFKVVSVTLEAYRYQTAVLLEK
jgi:SAM-dependent methyltransferase